MLNDYIEDGDVGLCWKTSPPIMILLSERAKAIIQLPEGVDAFIFLDCDPQEALEMFDDDYILVSMPDSYTPEMIITLGVQKLH
tara:strand:+ start:236 stop:487 length:252 start_codon:yes stop_codon:yes gene_type:complete